MKKNMKRIVTLVLCAVMALGLLAVSASADSAITYDGGLTVDKTATKNTNDYTISLEAALKQSACDIVLVVDQSGAMNGTYAQDNGEWEYVRHEWETGLYVGILPIGNHPPFGTGTWNDDGDYYMQDPYDETVYHKLERSSHSYSYSEFYWWVKYSYTDTKGVKHDITQHDVGEGEAYPYYYTRTWKGGTTYTKANKMEEQATALVSQIAAAAAENGLDHRIAVVGFSCGDTYNGENFNYANTGVYNGGTMTTYSNKISDTYGSALKNARTQADVIKASITASANLATRKIPALHNFGLEMADGILANNGDNARKKIVVVITGRTPGWTDVYDGKVADNAITEKRKLEAQGATIYTINMMESTDNTTDTFMNNISSPGCYTLAKTTGEFATAAAKVIENIKAQSVLPLDADTQLVDTLSTYFQFKSNPNVRYAWVSSGTEAFATVPTSQYSISGKTITLNGFAFNNHISTDTTSQKLVVKFDVEPATGFLGGNGVPTNEATSAIVNDGTSYKFPEPKVDVAIPTLTVTAQDKNVYLLGGVTADEMKTGVTIKAGTVSIDPAATNYGLASWQNEFVNISVTTDTAKTNLTADTTYSVSCAVTSKTNAANTSTASASANINVFKPVLTYNDKTIYLGQSPSLVPADTAWKHGDTASTAVTMLGSAPTLSDYTYSASDFSTCQKGVTLDSLKVNGTTISDKTLFTANAFNVHVLKPTLAASDVTIYRGNSVNLNGQVSISGWACGCNGTDKQTGTGTGAPTVSYGYKVTDTSAEVPAKPEDCTSVTATLKLNGTAYDAYTKSFTVHVLQPGFTVSTSDVWADYGVAVDLATHCVSYTEAWNDNNHTSVTEEGVSGKPSVDAANTAFTYGTVTGLTNGVYTVGESDQTINVTGLNYKFSNGLTGSETYTDKSFTVHVNTFKLTIKKNWAEGTASYKQDTIFTVTRGNEILRVVIPKGESSVTVAGLLCGQRYYVKEVAGWSWRCNDGITSSFKGARTHDHANDVSTTKPAEGINTQTFTNKLRPEKTLWLSGSDYVDNKWTGTAWSNGKNGLQALFN